MMPDLTWGMVWAATYFLHSSLLLGGVWLWFRWREPNSHAFREAAWKLATLGPIVTASLQLGFGIESPLNQSLRTAWQATRKAEPLDTQEAVATQGRELAAPKPVRRPLHREPRKLTRIAPDQTRWTTIDGARPADPRISGDLLYYLPDDGQETVLVDLPVLSSEDAQDVSSAAALSRTSSKHEAGVSTAIVRPASWIRQWKPWMLGTFGAVCGAAVALSGWGLCRLVLEQRDFRVRLATCRIDESGPARRLLDQLLQDAGVRTKVCLKLDDQDLEPGACGWLRWTIVLPTRAVDELSTSELRGLLAHELAHLVRGDQWWLLIGRIAVVCLGWQPLNRIALREWQRASEYLCDAWAIQRSVPRLSLARCLTTVAEWRLVGLATVAGLGSGNISNLSGRVERLVEDVPLTDPWQRYGRRNLLAAASCLVGVGMVSLAPAAHFNSAVPRNSAQSVAVKETRPSPSTFLSNRPTTRVEADVVEQRPVGDNRGVVQMNNDLRIDSTILASDSQIVITVQKVEFVRRRASAELIDLTAELEALRSSLAETQVERMLPVWQQHAARLQRRLENLRHLQQALVIPL